MSNKFLDLCIKNRKILGLSIDDVSDILGVSKNQYKQFEEGKYMFEEDMLKKIIKLYCINKNDLKDYSSLYDLNDVPSEILDITKDIINSIESGDL